MVGLAWNRGRRAYEQDRSIYFLIPVVEHGNAIELKTESREIRENWVRVSDGRNGIKLRIIQVDQKWRGEDEVV